MTLQQLQYFLATIEHGSFSAAAEALHMAQPSLSEQVRRLGGELGGALFPRVGPGVVLTDATWGVDAPTRRQLAELAQRAGVTLEPQIDVEEPALALELTSRGLGDTVVARGLLLALGTRVPRRLGWVPFAEPLYDTFAF